MLCKIKKVVKMRGINAFIVLLIIGLASCMEKKPVPTKPKMVIGIVVDQMRWDYLYRYYDVYGNDGFKRLLRSGYNCQNTSLNYLPSFTAPGHSCIYTGSVPSITGIAGNNWIDNKTGLVLRRRPQCAPGRRHVKRTVYEPGEFAYHHNNR